MDTGSPGEDLAFEGADVEGALGRADPTDHPIESLGPEARAVGEAKRKHLALLVSGDYGMVP